MRLAPETTLWTRVKRWAADFDAWLSASVFEGQGDFKYYWRRYSKLMNVFRFRGVRRAALDLASEAATLSVAGGMVMVTLAIPAFYETHVDWRRTQDFAVTFLDRNGEEVRSARDPA